jgi:hypothetical protein
VTAGIEDELETAVDEFVSDGGQAPRNRASGQCTQPLYATIDYSVGMPASEVTRIAKRWLKAHGDDAVALARDMVAELEESGNIDGANMWRQVIAAIEKLRRSKAK